MLDPEFSIRPEFPPVSYHQWRALAEEALRGSPFEKKLVTHTYESINQQPVYTRDDQLGEGDASGLPGWAPFVRGSSALGSVVSGWDLRQEHSTPDPAAANEAILADLEGGVTSLLLVLDRVAQAGYDPDDKSIADRVGNDGLMAYHVDDLDRAVGRRSMSLIAISIEAGAAFLPATAQMIALWQQRQLGPNEVRGALNADPLAVLAREGQLPVSFDHSTATNVGPRSLGVGKLSTGNRYRRGYLALPSCRSNRRTRSSHRHGNGRALSALDDRRRNGDRRCCSANSLSHQSGHASFSIDC